MALAKATIQALRTRVTRVFPMQVRSSLEKVSEEQIWWRPNDKSNSIGNLVLHISGSLDHYLNFAIGGFPYNRDRDAEFAARETMSKEQLVTRFDEMVTRADKTFDGLNEARLIGPSADPERYSFLFEDLLNIAIHMSSHAGQIMWVAKMLNEGGLDEVWMRSHKRGGAWK